jgi:hypothetical protein
MAGPDGTSAAAPAGQAPFPQAENRQPGTRAWHLTKRGAPGAIQGYASAVSVLPGQPFRLYVSTTAASFRLRAYRMGWYGGDRGRLVWVSPRTPGHRQPAPVLVPASRMVTCHWRPSLTVPTEGWPPGAYLLKLQASGGERYVPMVVRSRATAGKVVLLLGVTTWQAYNLWDGYDLYDGPGGFADRSYRVTFDRPYDGSGANAIYRHIRFASSPLGPARVIICYKVAGLDPMHGRRGAQTTQDWRDPPDPRPESVLTGVFYECNPVSVPYVVYDPGIWIFAGTGVRKGASFPGLVGPEYDRVNPAVPFPRPLEVLAHSPLSCGGIRSYSDSAYYTVRGGAGVFASGTMRWVCAMLPHCGHGVGRKTRAFVDRATQNVLRVFAAGPAGRSHPAHSNLAAVRPVRGAVY